MYAFGVQNRSLGNMTICIDFTQIAQIRASGFRKHPGTVSADTRHAFHPYLDMPMTTLTITDHALDHEDVITGPEAFQGTSITVVDGLKISSQRIEGQTPHGLATLFRLGGEKFGRMHQIRNLRVHDGRLYGVSHEPIDVGALVTIGWEDTTWSACRGVVAMSLRDANGWFVTIELDSALAA